MRTATRINHPFWMLALFGMLFLNLSAFAMDPDSVMKEGNQGGMMQNEKMSADQMIKKGDAMIAQGKEMKKKGMMMKQKEMGKEGTMKGDTMMKGNEMNENKMNGMKEMDK
ncbi:MAG TPA: hypothetical protein VMN77_08510 [Nitrospiria bacterium]|nr:hypothetical protein [Nitrospiria bacterium]